MTNFLELLAQQNRHWQPGYKNTTGPLKRDLFTSLLEALDKNRLIKIIEGPRRVGKSYLLWQLIENFLFEQKIPPSNLVYFQFQSTHNQPDFITKLIESFYQNLSLSPKSTKKIYFFLDEIQLVDYWQDQIKQYYDLHPNIYFVVSGSTSLFHRQRSRESLLGRIEKFKLGALNFLEYLRFKEFPNLPQLVDFPEKINPQAILQFQSNLALFRSQFKSYLFSGQYPQLAVHRKEKINPKTYLRDIIDILINVDLPYIFPRLDRPLFANILRSVAFNLADEFSFSNIAKDFEESRKRVAEYIRILEEINLFSPCLNTFFRKMRKKLAASKKIYALNSNLALSINDFDQSYLNDSRVFGHYVENYVFTRLRERFGKVEYYRDKTLEIDFVTEKAIFEVKSGKTKLEKFIPQIKKLKKPLYLLIESEYSRHKDYTYLPWYLL